MTIIAFQGEDGAYSQEAIFETFGAQTSTLPCPSFVELFRAVETGAAELGMLPIENSTAGAINQSYDLLLEHDLKISREVIFRVRHALMVTPGATIDEIKRVYSHPQALAQCERFIAARGWEPVVAYDTAGAAKQLAARLHGRLPVIYGAGALAEVARRWKTQFNENSKAWAFHEVFPELNHNAVVGYQFPKELLSKIRVILLRSSFLHERIQLRYRITGELLDQVKVSHEFVDGVGKSPLSQVLSLVLFGDYVSYYLAILYRVDPSPVKVIDYLKDQLAKD